MSKLWKNTIKVDGKIKPIHFRDRQPVELCIGSQYYVSFSKNEATPCTLISVDKREDGKSSIRIEIQVKPKSAKGFIDKYGHVSHHWVDTHGLYEDEIGRTPEEAVLHQVTL